MMSDFSKAWLARNPPQRLRKLSSEPRLQRVKRRRTSAFRSAWRERSGRPRKSAEIVCEPATRALLQPFGKHGDSRPPTRLAPTSLGCRASAQGIQAGTHCHDGLSSERQMVCRVWRSVRHAPPMTCRRTCIRTGMRSRTDRARSARASARTGIAAVRRKPAQSLIS